MKMRLLIALLLLVLVPTLARAQSEDPLKTEAREVVLTFCQAFLDGDADVAVDQIDSSAPAYQGYARMIPVLAAMTYAEAQLYDTVDEHFGDAANQTIRSSNSVTTMPYSIITNMQNLDVVLADDLSTATLVAPVEGEDPFEILMLNRVGEAWKIDAEASLGLELPQTEQEWAIWQTNTQKFITTMNNVQQLVPSFSTPEEYNEAFLEQVKAMQEAAGGADQ